MANIRTLKELDAAFEAVNSRADEERASLAREMWETPEIARNRSKFVAHLRKLGMSRAWAYQQAKVAVEGVKAIKAERKRRGAADRKRRSLSRDRQSDFDPTEAWTDAEIEADTGQRIGTADENRLSDLLGLARVALRVESLNLTGLTFSAANRKTVKAVITAWSKILHTMEADNE